MVTLLFVLLGVAVCWTLAYHRANGRAWSIAAFVLALAASVSGVSVFLAIALWAMFAVSVPLNIDDLRRSWVSDRLLAWFRKVSPQVSKTEQEALDAGTVWWDAELFSGRPDWNKLLATPKPRLSAEEQAFLDGPVDELCRLCDDWQISHQLNDLPPAAWQLIKDRGFLGMIIPKQYGGLGFSALAHSAVIMKLATRSSTACVSVMVPNSLGPAELLLHYGTDEQKNHYLPRLARGLEMPCFALTSPEAGSDAGAIPDRGVVCRGDYQGRDVLGMRVTWDKRYITLGPIATLLGLAFKLYDPDHLLGEHEDLGVTLALIPTATPGVVIGRRHCPLDAAFQNGPNSGKDVFMPLDWIIGGPARAGQGWRMLMECLAAGRSISLPSSATGAAKLASRTTGAYSRVRVQFNTAIGRFEGVEEALARIGANTYLMDAARVMTAGAVDAGEKPAVIGAIVKYHLTERGREVINDAMDVHGGKAICLGPNNYLGRAYQQIPIGITVEGANILTRSMIIFGQGAIRCHPYVLKEIEATRLENREQASIAFDAALTAHIRFLASNAARASFLGLTGGVLVDVPGEPQAHRYFRQATRFSAGFAFAADISMLVLGGDLKRKEKLSARLGDVLSQLYLASATLKRFEDDGRPQQDLPFLHSALQDAFYKTERAFSGLLQNFPVRPLAWLMRGVIFPLGERLAPPSDAIGHAVARALMEPGEARDRLTSGMFLPQQPDDAVARVEAALEAVVAAEIVEAKLRPALKAQRIEGSTADERVADALAKDVITAAEADLMASAQALRRTVIGVDDFAADYAVKPVQQVETQERFRKTA